MGDIPREWSTDPVKRHYQIQLGKMLQNSPQSDLDRLVPYARALHVLWGSVVCDDLPEMWANPPEVEQYGITCGDLLVCEGGEVGRAGIVEHVPENCIIQNALHRVRAKKTSYLRFLQYVLHAVSSAGWFDVLCNKATIAHFTREKFADLRIPIPCIDEQRAIASFLDRETSRIDALIAKKERQIELLQEKRAALISHAVTKGLDPNVRMKNSGIEWLGEIPEHWCVAPLYCRFQLQLGKMLDSKRITGEQLYPYLRNVDVKWGSVNTVDLPTMDFMPTDRVRFALRMGDLLVCEGGEVGRTAVWEGELTECYYQKALHRLRPLCEQDHGRFFYYVMFAAARIGAFEAGADLSTIGHLTGEKLRRHRFAFPPKGEQETITAYLDSQTKKIDEISRKVVGSIDVLREYRTALISAAVTGKIDVRGEVANVQDDLSGTKRDQPCP